MAKSRYSKYIVYEPPKPKPGDKPFPQPKRLVEARAKGNYFDGTWLFALDNRIAEGAFYTNCVWLWKKHGAEPLDIEIAHTHNFDETLGFVGTVRTSHTSSAASWTCGWKTKNSPSPKAA